jgi:hypothetical protein
MAVRERMAEAGGLHLLGDGRQAEERQPQQEGRKAASNHVSQHSRHR